MWAVAGDTPLTRDRGKLTTRCVGRGVRNGMSPAHRRSDRMEMPFAAAHESGFGVSPDFTASNNASRGGYRDRPCGLDVGTVLALEIRKHRAASSRVKMKQWHSSLPFTLVAILWTLRRSRGAALELRRPRRGQRDARSQPRLPTEFGAFFDKKRRRNQLTIVARPTHTFFQPSSSVHRPLHECGASRNHAYE